MEETLKIILDKINNTDSNFKDLKSEIKSIGNQITKIENEHGAKLDALLDGYKLLHEGQEI